MCCFDLVIDGECCGGVFDLCRVVGDWKILVV